MKHVLDLATHLYHRWKELQNFKLDYNKYDNFEELCEFAAQELNKNKIIGWFQNRSEFGPRALGSRSLLMHNDFPFLTYEQLAVLRLEVAERLTKQMSEEERFKYISDHIFHSLPLGHIECQGTLIRAGAGDLLDEVLKEILGEDYKVTAKKTSEIRRENGDPPL